MEPGAANSKRSAKDSPAISSFARASIVIRSRPFAAKSAGERSVTARWPFRSGRTKIRFASVVDQGPSNSSRVLHQDRDLVAHATERRIDAIDDERPHRLVLHDLDRILDMHAVLRIVVDEVDEGAIDLVEVERRDDGHLEPRRERVGHVHLGLVERRERHARGRGDRRRGR